MARRLIGLDVGTSAVRVVEIEPGEPPTLHAFGQVALPPSAMRDGEVQDPAAVAAAIMRLWRELDLPKKASVRVGIASPRVIVRPVDLAAMPEDELAGALRFQAQELVPIPIEDAYLDFLVQETFTSPDGHPTNRLLLAAAHRSIVDRLRSAVEAAGLVVQGIDLVPLALARSARLTPNEGAEAIVSVGAGVTVVVVHENGTARFVRMLGSGGRGLTDAVAQKLEVDDDTAEALKRRVPEASADLLARADAALQRPLDLLVEDIRGSLDYYLTQPEAAPITRVVVSGGGAQAAGFSDRLARATHLAVVPAEPRHGLTIGDIGFDAEALPRLDPLLGVPTGLALGGLPGAGRTIDLARGKAVGGAQEDRRKLITFAAGVAAVLILLLGFLSYQASNDSDNANAGLAAQQATNAQLQTKISQLSDVQSTQASIDASKAAVHTLLAGDVSWSDVLVNVAMAMPDNTWLTAFSGTLDRTTTTPTATPAPTSTTTNGTTSTTAGGATGTTPAGGGLTAPTPIKGSVTFTGFGADFQSVSDWISRIKEINSFTQVWISNAQVSSSGGSSAANAATTNTSASLPTTVQFTGSATLTPQSASNRAAQLDQDTK